jgi:hypothetical protein|tara:strand:- start:1612 stop:2019 length:408 start_codon:yes stop_codon:yes gene_type:complete
MQNENYAYFCYEMYKIKIIILSVLITILSAACNQTQSKIEKVIKEIEYAERNKKEIPSQQLEKLQLQIEELQQDLNENQENYSKQQIKQIGKIQGRYTALLLKNGIKDFQESVIDISNQIEGFLEGFKTDTITNQ